MNRLFPTLIVFHLLLGPLQAAATYPLVFDDAAGRTIQLEQPPQRVVSLVPALTEILLALGQGKVVVGTTHHDLTPEAPGAAVVGSFFAPDMVRVAALQPDLIFHAAHHSEAVAALGKGVVPVRLGQGSIEEGFEAWPCSAGSLPPKRRLRR
jgi:iron complex transport system substrate-binding protein